MARRLWGFARRVGAVGEAGTSAPALNERNTEPEDFERLEQHGRTGGAERARLGTVPSDDVLQHTFQLARD